MNHGFPNAGSWKRCLAFTWIAGLAIVRLSTASADEPVQRVVLAQQPDDGDAASQSGWRNFLGRRPSQYLKNHASIRAAYRTATNPVASSIVDVLGDDKHVALGTVVDPAGLIVTKASLLEGKIACRLADGAVKEAKLKGVDADYDVALLQVEATGLSPVVWRTEPTPPGTLVAAVASDGEAMAIGVISAEPREVPGPRRTVRRRAWLGVSLGGGDRETGVTDVMADSPAGKAGLKPGDDIESIDGAEMQRMEQVIDTIGSHEVGDTVSLVVRRGEQRLTLSAKLARPAVNASPQDQWGGGPFSERRTGFPLVLPHDTIVLPNQCGGPLVDTDGKAVGVNIARALRVITYAVPAASVQKLVDELKTRG